MKKLISILSYILLLSSFIGGIVIAILTTESLIMYIGIGIAVCSLAAGILTNRDISKLQRLADNAVYCGETIGFVLDIDTTQMKEQLKKDYPELNS